MTTISFHELYSFFLVFVRILGIFFLVPLFSQKEILSQAKISLAVALAIFVTPIVQDHLPQVVFMTYDRLFYYFLIELSVGLLIGVSAHILYITLDLVGHFMASESGLANAQTFNPAIGGQTPLTTNLLSLGAGVLLFTFYFHHTLIQVLVHSYEYIDTTTAFAIQDFHKVLLNSVHKMFYLGLQFSFPFIIIGIILHLSIGLINKLIPQIQIFSVMPPAQLLVGFLLFVVVLRHLLEGFSMTFKDMFFDLFRG